MSYSNYNYDYRRNRIIEPAQMLAAEDIFHPHSVQKYMLGCILDMNDGRRFRYCKAGGTLLKALMYQSEPTTTGWTEETNSYGPGESVGDKIITISLTTTAAKNEFAEGCLTIADGTPADSLGDFYIIKGNDVGLSATSNYTVKIYLADQGGLRGAITTSTEITVLKNSYMDVVVTPSGAPTGLAIGVPLVDVTDNYFYWSQTKGRCAILHDTGTATIGDRVGEAAAASGNGFCGVINSAPSEPEWGICLTTRDTSTADQPAIVMLTLE